MRTFAVVVIIGLDICLSGRLASVFAQPPREEVIKNELEKFQGTWRVVAVEENGREVPEDNLREARGTVTVEGDKHTLKYGDKSQGTVTITIDPTTKPTRYDMTIPEGPKKGLVLQGISELEGDTWRYCQDKTGKGRPTEFSGQAGSGWVLVIMKKERPAGDQE